MTIQDRVKDYKNLVATMLSDAGIILTDAEKESIEIADFGLNDLETSGLQLVTYVNNDR